MTFQASEPQYWQDDFDRDPNETPALEVGSPVEPLKLAAMVLLMFICGGLALVWLFAVGIPVSGGVDWNAVMR